MSGGSSTYVSDDVPSCDSIFEKTILNSPQAAVLAKLKKGDVLKILIHETDGRKSLVAVFNGEIAGSITSASLSTIKNCMDQGYTYIAIVDSVDGGRCTVLIRPEAQL